MGCSNRCHEPVTGSRPEAGTAPRIVSFSSGAIRSHLNWLFDSETAGGVVPLPRVISWVSSFERPAAPRETKSKKRLDIQGLRMIAVVAVVINHLTNHPVGGFVGVDVFFVISGYLIGGHLLREFVETQRIHIGVFYRRRIRRLIPAALTVTILTILIAHSVFSIARFHQTWQDGLWATAFWANWHFIHVGTNYFSAGLPQSPFQHYWSLSVEEQFYVGWPLLLLIVGGAFQRFAGKRRQLGARQLAGVALAVAICVGSLAFAMGQSSSAVTSAYFSTFTRAWELGLGALLASVVPRLPTLSARVHTAFSWLGMLLIAVSLFTVHGGSGFPAPGAILPCVGAALVIAAGGGPARNFILTNRASVYVGDISYSVYLVHFPVIILLAAWMAKSDGADFYATAVLLTAGLSILLYSAIEQPILRSNWLLPRNERRTRERSYGASQVVIAGMFAVVLAFVGLALRHSTVSPAQPYQQLAAAVAAASSSSPAPTAPPASPGAVVAPSASPSASPTAAPTPALTALDAELRSALLTTSWPTLSPTIDAVTQGKTFPKDINACGNTAKPLPDQCTWGPANATHTIELVGDSNSIAWAETFRTILTQEPTWKVRVMGGFACEFADQVFHKTDQAVAAQCLPRNNLVIADIEKTRPDLLVLTNLTMGDDQMGSVENELEKVKSYVGKIVVLDAPPEVKDPHSCYTPSSTPADCASPVSNDYKTWVKNDALVAADLGGQAVDVTNWFCVSGFCPAFAGTVPTRWDGTHQSSAYAVQLAPVLLEAFKNAHIFT
jgi:peptidoglycan/LPS O-acetylase OafA/YrhL